jgi:hypothetical protein
MPVDTIAIWMYFAITTVICGPEEELGDKPNGDPDQSP